MEELLAFVPENWQGIVATVVVVTSALGGVLRALSGWRKGGEKVEPAPAPAAVLDAMPDSLSLAVKVNKLLEFIVVHDPVVIRARIVQAEVLDAVAGVCVTSVLATKGEPSEEWLDRPTSTQYYQAVIVPLLNNRKQLWREPSSIGDAGITAMYENTPGLKGSTLYYIAHSQRDDGTVESLMLLSLHSMTQESTSPTARSLAVTELRKLANT